MKFIKSFTERQTANLNTIATRKDPDEKDGDKGALAETDPLFEPEPKAQTIDVLQMPWYAGKTVDPKRLSKIPRGFIIERRQKLNSLLSGAIYYLGTVLNAAEALTPKSVGSLLSKVTTVLPKNAIAGFQNMKDSFQQSLEKDGQLLKKNKLMSLFGIYLTEETGFKYAFPYLEGPAELNTSWGSEGEGTIAGLVNKGMGVIDEISRVVNVSQPGVYIQKPKYFSFDQEGKSVTFRFPLFNTIPNKNFNYKSNYELIWLLTYQNKPFKTSFARTTPGKIYTVEIPGITSMPYAYISDMRVDFRGTVRQLEVEINGDSFEAPIPEAYVVSITFTGLLTEFANTMIGGGFTSSISQNKAKFNLR